MNLASHASDSVRGSRSRCASPFSSNSSQRLRDASAPNRPGYVAFWSRTIRAGRFAYDLGLTFDVEQVVSNLESDADRMGKLAKCVKMIRGPVARQQARRHHGRVDKRTGFFLRTYPRALRRRAIVLCQQVDRLSALHSDRAAGVGDEFHDLYADIARYVPYPGKHGESERLQSVGREYRRCFVVFAVHGGHPAPQVVVVHGGQVVVNERECMNQLDCCGRCVQYDFVDVEAFTRGVNEQRAHALAAVENRVTHRLVQLRGVGVRVRQHAVEFGRYTIPCNAKCVVRILLPPAFLSPTSGVIAYTFSVCEVSPVWAIIPAPSISIRPDSRIMRATAKAQQISRSSNTGVNVIPGVICCYRFHFDHARRSLHGDVGRISSGTRFRHPHGQRRRQPGVATESLPMPG